MPHIFCSTLPGILGSKLQRCGERRKIGSKLLVQPDDLVAARDLAPGNVCKPISRLADGSLRFATMLVDVHPGEIGDELLIAKTLDIEDEQPLVVLSGVAIALGAEEESQLKRQIEARKLVVVIQLGS